MNRFYAPDDSRLRGSTVSYAESHDEERLAYVMTTDKCVSALRTNTQRQMLRLGSVAAQMLMSPGAHMIWQFEELGADQSTKNANGGNNTDPKTVVWNYLDNEYRAGLKDTYAALCAVRAAAPELFGNESTVTMNLSNLNWTTPRTIKLTKGTKEIVLVVNGNYTPASRAMDVPASFDASRYRVLAASHGTNPTLTSAKKVSLAGNCFVVFGTDDISSNETTISDITASVDVWANENGDIMTSGDYNTMHVYDLSGREVRTTALPKGIYIVRVDATVHKIAVR